MANINSNHNCFPNNTKPSDFKEFFPKVMDKFPPYYVCNFQKRDSMNNGIDNRREAFVRNCNPVSKGDNLGYEISPSATWRIPQAPKQTFNEFDAYEVMQPDFVNLGGRGDLFYGYARNIDVESELKKINYLDDKCFGSEYKINPNQSNSALYKYRTILDNKKIETDGKIEVCYDGFNPSTVVVKDKLKDLNKKETQTYLNAQEGTYRDGKLQPLRCLEGNVSDNQPSWNTPSNNHFFVGPGFDNHAGCGFPRNNSWNNMTKRKMIYTRQKNFMANSSLLK